MGEGREEEGGRSQLLTKSRLVSISHPHHPSPLGGAGGAGRGQGREVRFQQHTRPSLQGPFPGSGPWVGVGSQGSVSLGMGEVGCPPCRTARPGLFLLPSHSPFPDSDNDDAISQVLKALS